MPDNTVTYVITGDASQAKRAVDELTQTVAADAQKISASFQASSGTLRSAFEAATARAGTSVEKLGSTLKTSYELAAARAGESIRGLQQSTIQSSEKIGAEFKKDGDLLKSSFEAATQRLGISFKNLEDQAQRSATSIKTSYEAALQRIGTGAGAGGGAGAATQAQKDLGATVERTTEKTKELARQTEAVATAAQSAGTRGSAGMRMIEGIVERMLVRLIAVKVIFDAIRVAGAAITEAINWQAFSTRFESLSRSTGTVAGDLARFQQVARATGQSAEDIGKLDLKLQASGRSAKEAARDVETLAQYAAVAGVKAGDLETAFHAVELGTGTIDQMRELVFLEGEAGRKTLDQLNALERQDVALRRQQQDLSVVQQFEDRRYQLQRRAAEEAQRHSDAVEEFGNKLGLGNTILQQMAAGLGATSTQLHLIGASGEEVTVDLTRAGNAMRQMLATGERRIEQEQGLSQFTVRQLEQAGLIDSSFVLSAYHRQAEANRREAEYAHEDQQANRRLALAAAQYAMVQRQRQLEAQVTSEIEHQKGLATEMAKYNETAAAAIGRMRAAFAEIAQNSMPAIVSGLKTAADLAEKLASLLGRPGETRAAEAAQISARFFPTGGAPTPARLGFGAFPTASTGPTQSQVDVAIRESLARGAWASTERGVPAGYRPEGFMARREILPSDLPGMLPRTEAARSAVERAYPGGGAKLQSDMMEWLVRQGPGGSRVTAAGEFLPQLAPEAPPSFPYDPRAAQAYRNVARDWEYWSKNQWTGVQVATAPGTEGLSIPFSSQQRPGGFYPLSGSGGQSDELLTQILAVLQKAFN